MEDEFESAQEAFLVGRYLKENGLNDTLECFLKETPIKMVPKMPENMQSLPQILRSFRSLLKDREELKEKRRRMQQYEEILNLLFEELRDVYNFQSPPTASTFTPPADHEQSTARTLANKDHNVLKATATKSEGQFVPLALDGDDALIEDFCLQSLNQRPAENSGKVIPVVLPKRARQSKKSSSEEFSEGVRDGCESSENATRNLSSGRAEGQPVYSRGQALEHHYNRIREHRRLNGRSKRRFLEKPMSLISNFVAYSSLPVTNDKASCGHNGKPPMVYGHTHKQSRSKKHVGADIGGHGTASSCAALQSASCQESSNVKNWEGSCKKGPFGGEETLKDSGFDDGLRHGNQSAEARLNQGVLNKGNDVTGCNGVGAEVKYDWNKGTNSEKRSHPCEISWSITSDIHTPHPSITKASSLWDLAVSDASDRRANSEERQLLERNFQKHVDYGGGLHYKAFLREKFFSTRRKQGTTIHKQELLIHHHEEPDCCSPTSSSEIEHDQDFQKSWTPKKKNMNGENGTEPVDAALLASETANLLERLLPLVADSGTMQSFISSLDTRTPRPSPRDLHTQSNSYWSRLCSDKSRSQGLDVQPSSSHEPHHAGEITEEADIDDDSSVLAELEEAVGQTVDEILRRYILISPVPQAPVDPH